MGCWDELEARKRFEESVRKKREAAAAAAAAAATGRASGHQSKESTSSQPGATLFDAAAAIEAQSPSSPSLARRRGTSELRDGFETMSVGGAPTDPTRGSSAYLDVFRNVRSMRGAARHEYGKIYGALAPFYFDLVGARSHADPVIFRAFRDPEGQAQMLANLGRFAKSDWTEGCAEREEKVASMTAIFETAVLREFEQGYEFWDVDGRMRRYAHVLHVLGEAHSGIDLFIHKHPIFDDKELMVNPVDCLSRVNPAEVDLEPSRQFFEVLLAKVNDQAGVIERIFPNSGYVFTALLERVKDDIIMEYTTSLFDEAHERSIAAYLKALSGVFEQTLLFFQSVTLPQGPGADLSDVQAKAKAKELSLKIFEPHLDLYLQDELDFFTREVEAEVNAWEKKLSEQDLSLESFWMSNINRTADKTDFLTSFRKVVMMPVNALPHLGSPFGTMAGTTGASKTTRGPNGASAPSGMLQASQAEAPRTGVDGRNSPLPANAPTDELAAKAALMAHKLEGIKSLFSIEIALNLVHTAKTSLERAAVFMKLGGQVGEEAREHCGTVFVVLLRILGQRHVKSGFDRAITHLSHYNPREVSDHSEKGVAPLVTFIELVNVGDLISQMIDVFYEQQLATPKIADKNDFLDPAGMAKKKFEQMLDESVAAGLNKGIDVLMDEVEYLQGTMQAPTDYNPGGGEDGTSSNAVKVNIGPTPTAARIVDLVSSHTKMLTGTTDKLMLDVFNGEVGLRLFTAICKHLKRQRVSTDGAVPLIADMNLYFDYVRTLRNPDLLAYFKALRELSQIYLIDAAHAKEMATVIADGDRFGGVFRAEEVYEYAQRRADWYQVRKSVERAMYGLECVLM